MDACLIIMPLLFRGGSEKQIRYVIEAINKEKLPLTVIVESSDPSMHDEEMAYQEQQQNIEFVFLNTNAVDAKYAGTMKKYLEKFKSLRIMLSTVKQVVNRNKIKTVMVTNLTGLVLLPWFKLLGCNVIYNERNPGVKVCNRLWKRILLKKCSKLVCNSEYASHHMSNKLGRNVEVINNGIQAIELPSIKRNEKKPFTIIVPARISKVKNQKVILEALNILKKEFDIKAVFAGVIEDNAYFEELKEYCRKYQLDNEADFIGFTSDIYSYYSNSDLLILASYEEGTPNVLLEAFMCRLKVLASDIPMNRQCMSDKWFLFETENADQLAEKIRAIRLLNSDETKEILDKNYDFVTNNYSIDKMGRRYINVLYRK